MKKLFISLMCSLVVAVPAAGAQMTVIDAGGPAGGNAVIVDSNPPGAPFALEGPAHTVIVTGKTPVRIINIPAHQVMIHYGDLTDCLAPRPQQRDISVPVHFFGSYSCPRPDMPPVTTSSAGVKLSAHKAEVPPGGVVRFTLAVHNFGSVSTSGIVARVQYNAANLTPTTLLQGGKVTTPGTVQWNVPAVDPGETWTTVFETKVADELTDGARISLSGRISGANLVANAQNISNVTVSVPLMPSTGAASVLFLLGMMMMLAAGATALTRRVSA